MTTVLQKPKSKLAEAKVLKRRDLTPELMLIWLEPPNGFSFKPGQYCTIGIDGIERPYSIVSAPSEDSLELFIELIPEPDGILTPELWKLGEGDKVTFRPKAKGVFTMDTRQPSQLFVSTVTGVVPYVSMIREYIRTGKQGHRFYVLEGASYVDELGYDTELERISAEHPDLVTYVPTISRPNEQPNNGWTGEIGRVNEIVETYIEKYGLSPEDTLVYACGHPGMIEDVKRRAGARGFEVREERFWKEN